MTSCFGKRLLSSPSGKRTKVERIASPSEGPNVHSKVITEPSPDHNQACNFFRFQSGIKATKVANLHFQRCGCPAYQRSILLYKGMLLLYIFEWYLKIHIQSHNQLLTRPQVTPCHKDYCNSFFTSSISTSAP